MKKKFAEAHDNGDIHIHDMDFEAMGTTTCMQIDLNKLFKGGFSTGHGHLREPKDIMSYSALAAIDNKKFLITILPSGDVSVPKLILENGT